MPPRRKDALTYPAAAKLTPHDVVGSSGGVDGAHRSGDAFSADMSTDTVHGGAAPVLMSTGKTSTPVMKFTSLTGVSGAIQTKNMSSAFTKEDGNIWWDRRLPQPEPVIQDMRERKRRRVAQDVDHAGDSTPNGQAHDELAVDQRVQSFPLLKGKGKAVEPAGSTLMDPSKVLIIQPGSRTLRLGRASDSYPWEVPNVIARKLQTTELAHKRPAARSSSGSTAMSDDKIEMLRMSMRERMRILTYRGTPNGTAMAAEYNATVRPTAVTAEDEDAVEPIAWTDVASLKGDVLFAEDALRVSDPQASGWSLRFPILRGAFDMSLYTSTQEVLGDVMDIWLNALRETCDLDIGTLGAYGVILLIPDLYEHEYVQHMCDLILRVMGFAQVIVHQESLAATFAAGLPSGCVIDMGACKTSVSCVDEGMIISDTRMQQSYGGEDILETFYTIAKSINFPYREADLKQQYDRTNLQNIVQQTCGFNEVNFSVNLADFIVQRPGHPPLKYSLQMYDEITLPTFCYWAPRVLDWISKAKPARLYKAEVDCIVDIGGDAVTAAMKRSVQHLESRAVFAPTAVAHVNGMSADSQQQPQIKIKEQTLKAVENEPEGAGSLESQTDIPAFSDVLAEPGADMQSGHIMTPEPPSRGALDYAFESSKLPLEVAVCESIAQAGSDEKIKRVVTNILVVGGVANMPGVAIALQSRLAPLLRQRLPTAPAPLVIPANKYADPAHMAWKGVTSLCKLDVSNDLWIRADDWELLNLRAVRDRSCLVDK